MCDPKDGAISHSLLTKKGSVGVIYLVAVVGGLLAGAALGFGWGMLAATLYTNIAGAGDGGPAMAGFFYVGPFGLVAGFQLAAGA